MNKEEVLKAIMELPKIEINNPISAMNSISVDDLMSAIDRFDKVPTYDELLKENKQLKEELKAVNKGLRKVLYKRKKWKDRYYKEKRKNRKAIKYIEEKIQKSFKADYGLEPFERTDRLFTETVFELQTIEQILDKGVDKQ